jgi:hypothetical protein
VGQRGAVSLVVQFGEPVLYEGRHGAGEHLVVSSGTELALVPRMALGPGGANRVIAQDLGSAGV